MCRPIACKQCGKTTWAGCGQHIADVKRTVPVAQWCGGHEKTAATGGFFSKLIGR